MGDSPGTSAFGGSTSTLAEVRGPEGWRPRPFVATTIRLVALVTPLVAAVLMVRIASSTVPPPATTIEFGLWFAGATAVALATARVVARFSRRLLPLAGLFRMTLAFPDSTPSRMKVALRTGTARDLERRLADGGTLGSTAAEAAENLLALLTRLKDHDRLTRGHSERVRAYTDLIAEEMDLDPEDRAKLHWGALAHDVGKLGVDPNILSSDTQPSQAEWEALRRHPDISIGLTRPLEPWLGEWLAAASQHHERFDGEGYPFGLRGRDIHLAGRIVAVADAFDTMTSVRSYKKALSFEDARAELIRNAGTQFDPQVVRAFLDVGTRDLHLVAGPLSWLAAFPGVSSAGGAVATGGGAVASGVATAATAAAAVTGTLMTGGVEVPPLDFSIPEVTIFDDAADAPPLAFRDETTTPTTTFATTADDSAPASSTTTADPTVPSDATTSTTSATGVAPTTTTVVSTSTTVASTTTSSSTTTTTTTPSPPGAWAVADAGSGPWGQQTQVFVLANDTPPAAVDGWTLSIVELPTRGTATVHVPPGDPSEARVRYTPFDGWVGTETFAYKVCDVLGDCAGATITFTSTDP